MADEIIIPIVAEVGNKKSYKSIQDYTNFLESSLKEAFDTSMLKPLDDSGKKWHGLVKVGRKYQELIVNTTKKGKLKSFNFVTDKEYSLKEARKLMSASSTYGAEALRKDIKFERQKEAKLEQARKKKAKEPVKLTNEELKALEEENLNKQKEQNTLRAKKALDLSNIIGSQLSGIDLTKHNLNFAKRNLADLEKQFAKLKEGDASYNELKQKIIDAQKEVNNLTDDLKKQNKELLDKNKLSGVQKLVNTFKRVGFYRIARRTFQLIEQGLSQSITNLAKFDSGINDTMSSLTSSFTILSNSVGVVVAPLLKIIEPILSGLAKTIGNVANTISYLIAKLTGSSKYLKVNTEYLKDFNNEMNLLSFDKFESLNQQDDVSSMFEEADVADGFTESMQKGLDIIKEISYLLIGIGGYLIVSKFLDGSILKGFEKIGNVFTSGGWVKFAGIAGVILGISSAVEGIIELIRSDGKSVTAWIKTILGLVAAVAGVVAMIKGKTIAGMIAGGIAVASTVGIIIANSVASAKSANVETYANGGLVEQGSLFVAGEAGAELVTTMPSGQTGVTNIAQFRQATVEALYEWWSDAKYDIPEGSTTYLDGAQIARSKSFKSELNRTNSGLNLR